PEAGGDPGRRGCRARRLRSATRGGDGSHAAHEGGAMTASRMGRALAVGVLAAIVAVVAVGGCTPAGPREIAYGDESCGFCRMTITDPRHGAQVRTAHGRVQAFDAIE